MANADIDRLDIVIEANSSRAEEKLTKIASSLAVIAGALRKASQALGVETKATEKNAEATDSDAKATEQTAKAKEKLASASNKASGAVGKLMKSLGRIAFYRAIRTAIKNISSAIKEGLTNLYTYSQEVGTAFAPAVDNLRQHVMLLKNAFATALRPVIEALIPVIIKFVDALAAAADWMAQVFSAITGNVDENGRYTKAILTDLEDSNDEAKALRRTLLGFDEINRLDGDNGSKKEKASPLQFVQADISPGAAKVAKALKSVDWKRIMTFLEVLGGVVILLKGLKLASKIGEVVGAVGGLIDKIGLGNIAVVALIAVFGAFGDKIAAEVDRMTKDTAGFFNSLKGSGSQAADAVADLCASIAQTVGTVISKLASAVYKLVHGDWKGALCDLIDIIAAIIVGAINIIEAAINIILGIVADAWNLIARGATWLWNNAIQPLLNDIIWGFKQFFEVIIPNAWIDIKSGVLAAVKWILEALNTVFLKPLEDDINGAIKALNELFGWDIKPLKMTIDTSAIDQTITELQDTKLPDIDQNIDFIAKWDEPEPWKPKVDFSGLTNAIYKAADYCKQKVNEIGEDIKNAVGSVGSLANLGKSGSPAVAVRTYASGGFPTAGSMFIAGESGAEWVGDINGNTGVMNTEQMAAAIYEAMSAALANNPSGGDIYLDGEVIYQNTVRRNNNTVRSTGRSALLV